MPTPYRILSDDTLMLLAERGNAQALMELGYRSERLAILAEAQELANRLREHDAGRDTCPGNEWCCSLSWCYNVEVLGSNPCPRYGRNGK